MDEDGDKVTAKEYIHDEKSDIEQAALKYHGSYLKKRLFRSIDDLNETVHPEKRKVLMVLVVSAIFMTLFCALVCRCKKKKRTAEEEEEMLA